MSEQKRIRAQQGSRKATTPSAKPPEPSLRPTALAEIAATPAAVVRAAVQAEGAAVRVDSAEAPHDAQGSPVLPLEVLTAPALCALRAQLAFAAELGAEWRNLFLVASRSASALWLGKV